MSEYQFYEFLAIDRPLADKEMRELRSFSTRARITPASFVNHYEWGGFRGDVEAWMDQYFDAFLYLANWGTHVLKLRVPSRLLDARMAREYCGGKSACVREKAGRVVLSFESRDEEGGDWVEGDGLLSSMVWARNGLVRGDLRALYLGWLLRVQTGELDEGDEEPPVPPGVGELDAALESLAEFLRIDRDLLHVAAHASVSLEQATPGRAEASEWLARIPAKEKDEVLASLIVDADQAPALALLRRFRRERVDGMPQGSVPRRTVGELRRSAASRANERRRAEAEERAREQARRECEAAAARDRYLSGLAGRVEEAWVEIGRAHV
jgi:hypothetical protein